MTNFSLDDFLDDQRATIKEPDAAYPDAWYMGDEACVRVTAMDDATWGEMTLELDCTGPPPEHWLAYEMNAGSLDEALGLGNEEIDHLLLEHGVAPGQPFYLRAKIHTSRDYYGEYDCEIESEVIGKVPWSTERACLAWEAYLGRKAALI